MRLPRLSLCAPLVALALLALPAPAFGEANHPFLSTIAGLASPSGGFEDACGVALDSSSNVYVADYYHDAIDVFSSSGKYVSQFAKENPGDGPCKLALDSSGDLYVNNWHQDVVKYTPSEIPSGPGTVIDSAQPTGLAVDPATNNVYVAHRTYVAEYGPTGALIREIGVGSLEDAYGVAVSDFPATAGYVYVPDAADNTVKVFNATGALVEEMNGAATPQEGFKYLVDAEVAVDNGPNSASYGHLYVLDAVGHGLSEHPEAALDEFNAAGDYRGQITGFTDAEPSGIAIDQTGRVYVTSGNSEGSAVFVYGLTALARTLTVTKAGTGDGSVTSSPAGIACGQACRAEYNVGELVTFFATPNSHSAFSGWTVIGSQPCPGTNPSCTVRLEHNTEVIAGFEEPTQKTLTLTLTGEGTVTSSPAGISCPGACSEHFNEGRVVTLTAHPSLNSRFAGWGGVDCDESTATTCQVTMSATKALAASFAPIPQPVLSVTKTGSGQGTVTSSPAAISCPGTCSAGFDEGTAVFLTASPAPTSSFAGFTGGGCSGTAPICQVTMSSAQSVSAEFRAGAQSSGVAASSANAATLSLGKLAVQGSSATLELTVSGPGTVLAAGQGLQGVETSVAPGTVAMRLALTRAGRRALAKHGRLKVKVALAFAPADGADDAAATRAIGFKTRQRFRAKCGCHSLRYRR